MWVVGIISLEGRCCGPGDPPEPLKSAGCKHSPGTAVRQDVPSMHKGASGFNFPNALDRAEEIQ